MAELQESKNEAVSYEVKVSGNTCTQDESKGLERLTVEDHQDKIGLCIMEFSSGEVDWSGIKEGDDVEVSVGGSTDKLFVGTVSSVRHSWKNDVEVIVVEAMDPLIKLAASTATKAYNVTEQNQSDDQIVSSVLSDAGVDAGQIDSSSLKQYTLQLNESYLSFLKKLAGRNGYLLRAKDGKVDFVKPQGSDPAVEIPPEQLMNMNSSNDQSMIPKKVVVIGWDYFNKKVVKGECSSSSVAGVGSSGSKPDSKTYSGTRFVTGVRVGSDSAAKSMAEGIMERAAKNRVQGRATIQGNGQISAGKKVKFTGQQKSQNPDVMVKSATHILEPKTGFRTQINFFGEGAPS